MNQITLTYSLDTIDQAIDAIKPLLPECKVLTFTGSLGAGKTTFIGELLRALGVKEPVTSPTFSYMNVYTSDQGTRFVHFDLYRLDSLDQFIEAGFDEWLPAPHHHSEPVELELAEPTVLIEWPEIIMPMLKNMSCCHMHIDYAGTDQRTITIKRCVP